GFDYLDTGAMYRTVALAAIRRGIDPSDAAAVEPLLAGIHVEALAGHVVLNGEDVTALIRTPEVAQGASKVAAIQAVRGFRALGERRPAAGRSIVCEGRDQGTFVFPDAGCKFFLTADPLARAERRFHELLARGEQTTLDAVLKAQQERDVRDASRDLAPLKTARDPVNLHPPPPPAHPAPP